MIGDKHSPSQVCHTGYEGRKGERGETCAFLWQLPLLFNPHGRSPLSRARRDPEPLRTGARRATPGVSGAGTRKKKEDGEAPPFPPRSHTQSRWTARLPADSTAAILWRKKKIEPWRFNGLRGLPSEKRGREGGETKATRLRQLRDSFCITEATVCRQFGIRQLKFRVALRPVSRFFFPRRVRDNRHGAAPTWPDCNDCAEVKRAHTEGGKHIFIWRSYPLN